MIIIETAYFITFCFFTIFSLSGLGQILIHKINKNFFESIFYGFIVAAFCITLIHFFLEISVYLSLIILIAGFLIALKRYNLLKIKLRKKLLIYLVIFLVLIPIYISQKYHEDFGYYHLPYIINIINEKIIFGLANLNRAFVHNSIWINIQSIFYFKNNYNYVSMPTFLIYSLFIIYSFDRLISKKQNNISSYFLIVSIFYLILKFTRISEFGNDIPSILFSILSIFNFLRFNEEKEIDIRKKIFYNNFSFAIFAILIKFSSIPILLLTLYLFFKNYKIIIKDVFKFHYIFIYLVCLLFFLQQFIYTGCFIFPSNLSCFDVSWFDEYFLNSKYRLELINKSYFGTAKGILSEEEYLKNFNWIPFWFKRSYPGMLEHLLTMILPLVLFLFFLKKKKSQANQKFYDFKYFIFFLIFGFLFWLNFSPVYRFGIIYFLSLVFFVTFLIYKQKILSKKIFVIFISLFLFFNFSKNIKRLNNEDKIFFGIKKIDNSYILNTKNNDTIISIFQPDMEANGIKGNGWQGRLCWDIKFICTKNKVDIKKVNNYLIIKKSTE
tara:strand:- start:165 stop:1820 length:1656 start_codon:yes stop_codon:yes gene_type:complete